MIDYELVALLRTATTNLRSLRLYALPCAVDTRVIVKLEL